MIREKRKRLVERIKNRRIFFYVFFIILIIATTILMIVFGIPEGDGETDLLAVAGVVILPLVLTESVKQGFSYMKTRREGVETEEKLFDEFKQKLIRFTYHWDLGTLRPEFTELHEDIVAFLEKNLILILKEADENKFTKIEELYKTALEFKIPVKINKENYKDKKSEKFDIEKFEKFIELCKLIVENI